MSVMRITPFYSGIQRWTLPVILCAGLHLLLFVYLLPLLSQPPSSSPTIQGLTLNLASVTLLTAVAPSAPAASPSQSEEAQPKVAEPAPASPQSPSPAKPKPTAMYRQAKVRPQEKKTQEKKQNEKNSRAVQTQKLAATQENHSAMSTQMVENRASATAPARENSRVAVTLKPRFRTSPAAPVYPQIARQRGEEGTALIAIELDATGQIKEISLLRSSGYSLLDKEALKAARKWQFLPPELNGVQQAGLVQIPVRFKLT